MQKSSTTLRIAHPIDSPVAETQKRQIPSINDPNLIPRHSYNMNYILSIKARSGYYDQLPFRDCAIIQSVFECRLMTAKQIERLYFYASTPDNNARSCRNALQRMAKTRYLTRLDRSIGGFRAGSSSFVYSLGPKGRTLVDLSSKRPQFDVHTSHHLLNHTLTIAEVYVMLHEWDRQGAFKLITIQTEPNCWREYRGMYESYVLKPDMYIRISFPRYNKRMFLEIDRATHYSNALKKKAAEYRRYFEEPRNYDHEDNSYPITVWTSPSIKRVKFINRAIKRVNKELPGLFKSVTIEQLQDFLTARKNVNSHDSLRGYHLNY